MNAVIISQENFDEVIKRLDKIQNEVSKIQFEPKDLILDNAQVCQIISAYRSGRSVTIEVQELFLIPR